MEQLRDEPSLAENTVMEVTPDQAASEERGTSLELEDNMPTSMDFLDISLLPKSDDELEIKEEKDDITDIAGDIPFLAASCASDHADVPFKSIVRLSEEELKLKEEDKVGDIPSDIVASNEDQILGFSLPMSSFDVDDDKKEEDLTLMSAAPPGDVLLLSSEPVASSSKLLQTFDVPEVPDNLPNMIEVKPSEDNMDNTDKVQAQQQSQGKTSGVNNVTIVSKRAAEEAAEKIKEDAAQKIKDQIICANKVASSITEPGGDSITSAPTLEKKKMWGCGFCDAGFAESEELNWHIRSIHGPPGKPKEYSCKICGAQFPFKTHLVKHAKIHVTDQPMESVPKLHYACTKCGALFRSKEHLRDHIKVHNNPRACEICMATFETKMQLKSHKKIHHPCPCRICFKQFNLFSELKKHEQEHKIPSIKVSERPPKEAYSSGHEKNKKIPPKHDNTLKTSSERKVQIVKKNTPDKPMDAPVDPAKKLAIKSHRCGICERKFLRLTDLSTHLNAHKGQPVYSCHICGGEFLFSANLENHLGTHTAKNPYVCDICGADFVEYHSLVIHKGAMHTTRVVDPYCCGRCGKAYETFNDLAVHMSVCITKGSTLQ